MMPAAHSNRLMIDRAAHAAIHSGIQVLYGIMIILYDAYAHLDLGWNMCFIHVQVYIVVLACIQAELRLLYMDTCLRCWI